MVLLLHGWHISESMFLEKIIEQFVLAACRKFLYEAGHGTNWFHYRLAMNVVYDENGLVRTNPYCLPVGKGLMEFYHYE